MHGLIFVQLKKYASSRLGPEAWDELLRKAALTGRMYLPVQQYPDDEFAALVRALSLRTGGDADALLENLGAFMAPELMRMYGSLLRPSWTTLDVVEHTEHTIHRVVRARNPGARPPELKAERTAPDEVVVTYDSPRRMCGFAKGVVRGLARHFRETVTLDEETCMLRGDACCRLRVRKA
ncbi:MAG: heme NO-binding domain-containing protein [Vicinamibacteria bacterium]